MGLQMIDFGILLPLLAAPLNIRYFEKRTPLAIGVAHNRAAVRGGEGLA